VTAAPAQLPLGGRSRADELLEEFLAFHRENPHVWELFEHFAQRARRSGRGRYSADAICHRIRWELEIETRSEDGLRLNDHHSAYYARLYMAKYPAAAGFFRTRKRPSVQVALWDEAGTPGVEDEHLARVLRAVVREGGA